MGDEFPLFLTKYPIELSSFHLRNQGEIIVVVLIIQNNVTLSTCLRRGQFQQYERLTIHRRKLGIHLLTFDHTILDTYYS